jgi:peptidoglycan/xylan/chitin deacetylase (PgdA/CDA1 family)
MTKKLLGKIRANHIPTIGFVNEGMLYEPGEFKARVAILRMWLDAGLELGNHTFSHMDLQTAPLDAYEADVIRGESVTAGLLRGKGKGLRYFRYPYLHVGRDLATRRAVEKFLAERGYTVAPVTLNNQGYIFAAVYARAVARGDRGTAKRVGQAYLSYMEQVFDYYEKLSVDVLGYEVKQVLLLHADALNADCFNALVRMMRARGYSFVSLGQALRDKAYRLPDSYSGEGGVSWIHHWAFTMGKKAPRGPEAPDSIKTQYEARPD